MHKYMSPGSYVITVAPTILISVPSFEWRNMDRVSLILQTLVRVLIESVNWAAYPNKRYLLALLILILLESSLRANALLLLLFC